MREINFFRMMLNQRAFFLISKRKRNWQSLFFKTLSTNSVNKWEPTVGLEIHAQIATESKLFSKASTKFTDPVNTSVSFFDAAIPGTMPVLNRKCVEAGVLTALALSCDLNEISIFERKHYFYADLPAGFQITQQKKPLAVNGEISFYVFTPTVHKQPYLKTSKIKQIQLEQDSGRSLHIKEVGKSLIDLNRAGIPLMEFVFEPDLKDGEEAAALVKELSLILEILGTCSCKMEEGALRVDANVSIAQPGHQMGTRTELKNIGSVRAVAAAVKYEIDRQISILEAGGEIVNETRAWDRENNKTIPMREKEEKLDYRFMPETNLPPLFLSLGEDAKKNPDLIDVLSIQSSLPVLPKDIRYKLINEYGMQTRTVFAIMSSPDILKLFLDLKTDNSDRDPQALANFILNELLTTLNKYKLGVSYCMDKIDFIAEVYDMRNKKEISYKVALELLDYLKSNTTRQARQIVEDNDWYILTDEAVLSQICSEVLSQNANIVQKYKQKKKKHGIFKFIITDINSKVDNKADLRVLATVLRRMLDG